MLEQCAVFRGKAFEARLLARVLYGGLFYAFLMPFLARRLIFVVMPYGTGSAVDLV